MTPDARPREQLYRTVSPRVRITREDGRTIVLMGGRPFVSEGIDSDGALADLVLVLREYAADWDERLAHAPNHAEHRTLVQLVQLSTDAQLVDWMKRGGR